MSGIRPPRKKKRPRIASELLRVFDSTFEPPVLGMDEVGLGCIAGPVFAGGAVIPDDLGVQTVLVDMGVNDSKKLSPGSRERIYDFLVENHVFFCTAQASVEDLDRVGLYSALDGLYRKLHKTFATSVCPKTVLIDGRGRRALKFRYRAIVGGDGKSMAIATASIVAKVERDRYMDALAKEQPGYAWELNKGYPTGDHLRAIEKLCITKHHRLWTKPLRKFIASRR